jgi:FKBP-type peptidyl-prolyl cis-trans isomerase SlyD
MKRLILLAIIGMLLAGCTNPPQLPANNTTTVKTAYYGDVAAVNYILTVDGAVIDTNIESVAKANLIYNSQRKYTPLTIPVLIGGGYINGFVKGIVGMKEGETKSFVIEPEDGYGLPDESLIYSIPKYYNKSALETVPMSYFKQRNLTIENGTTFKTEVGTVFVDSFNETDVVIMYMYNIGESFTYNGLKHTVIGANNWIYEIMLNPDANTTYQMISPRTGKMTVLTITDVSDDKITIDENYPLAGKKLYYEVTLLKLEKAG